MDPSIYVYTVFVFILVLVVIWLVARVVRFKKKSTAPSTNEKESLFKLYQSMEDMMNSLEEYVEKAREDMAKDKQEAAAMLDKMENLHREMKERLQTPAIQAETREPVLAAVPRIRETAVKPAQQSREYTRPAIQPAPEPAVKTTQQLKEYAKPAPVQTEPAMRSVLSAIPGATDPFVPEGALKKNKIVRFMRDEGLSDEQIAKELGISRGEVALILGMKEN